MVHREKSSHGGEEVFAYATGASSAVFSGLLQNTDVFYFFCFLLDLPDCRQGSWATLDVQGANTRDADDETHPLLPLILVLLLASLGLNLIQFIRTRRERRSMNVAT